MSEQLVAFLGPTASYTHAAALQAFSKTNCKLQPVPTIEDIVAAVASGSADRGVVPFENSTNGPVPATLDLFASASGKYGEIVVIAEEYVPVNHCIVGFPAEGDGGRDLSHVTTLYSHPQAWGQCKRFLSQPSLKKTEQIDVSSTSRGAELVSMAKNPASAAISSALAAKQYNLSILAENIQDVDGNMTRFLVIRKQTASIEQHTVTSDHDTEAHRYKTLITFTVPHTVAGSLADCLAIFKQHNLNLTSINSRPKAKAAWEYIFFAEFRGRKGAGGEVSAALGELGRVAGGVRWLGSWEDGMPRAAVGR